MRTRSRTINATTTGGSQYTTCVVVPSDPNYPLTQPYNPRIYTELDESMVDEEPRLIKSGSCTHIKTARTIYKSEFTYTHSYNGVAGPPNWPVFTRTFSGSALYEKYVGGNGVTWGEVPVTVPSTWDWTTLSFAAVQQMKPTLNKEGLLLNNLIIESKAACSQAAAHWKNRNIPTAMPQPQGWASRGMGLLRGLAGFNLLYQFAIKPTISDIQTIITRIKTLRELLESLIIEGDKVQTRHYKCPLADRITLPADIVRGTSIAFADYPGYTTTDVCRWVDRPTYHATLRYSYDVSRIRGLLGSLRASLDAFGVSRLLSTLWEAIPYSFVVDWFFGIQTFIRSLEERLGGDLLPIQILDFVHSIKYKYVNRILHTHGIGARIIMSDILLKNREVSLYIRKAEAPCLWDTLSVRTPSLNQAGLGASLIVQSGTKSRRK